MLQLVLTSAGYAALLNADNTGVSAGVVVEIGLTDQQFIAAATLEALPGEFKRVNTVGGLAVADDTIHVTMTDSSADAYSVRGFALYLDDGTLIGCYCQDEAAGPLVQKAAVSQVMLAEDVVLTEAVADTVTFGATTFQNPPATTTQQGVVELADVAESLAGADQQRAVTPFGLKAVVDALVNGAGAALDTLFELAAALGNDANFAATVMAAIGLKADKATTVGGGGLATGGGDLSANRTITVTKAAEADVRSGDDTKAVTGKALKDYGRWDPGDIKQTARSDTPAGWLYCNGQAVSRATYADLFTAIGTRYGVGDGATTFNVPDYRGVVIRGLDDGRGYDYQPARAQGSYQGDQNKAHTHGLEDGFREAGGTWDHGSGGAFFSGGAPVTTTESSGGAEVTVKNVAERFLIKT